MFPGFVTLYRDKESKVHLYFYPGINENGDKVYNDLDISKINLSYEEIDNNDGSKDFIFDRNDIVEIKCKLIRYDGKIDYETLVLK